MRGKICDTALLLFESFQRNRLTGRGNCWSGRRYSFGFHTQCLLRITWGILVVSQHVADIFDAARLKRLIESDAPIRKGQGAYRNWVKRVLDVAIVLIALVPTVAILVPLMAIIALDGRSPIYVQKRVGKDGRVFRMFKLRSMVAGADQVLDAYLARDAEAKAEWDRTQKLKSDPRVTGFGQFIRKTSLDELPQLLNVLWGDMSIVGPRPMMVEQREIYPGAAYYEMRPGITGFWQVSERNESSFSERATYDTNYFRQMSPMTDLRVIAATVKVVLRGTGY
ncbi:sugar transferase [Aquicoccus porphyridii]|uniref:Sugar transferase n=1 Tax=Aquicoccus porphyridii TaxID=1852029 RepID=A0A5A9ZSK5_9RHOB|nr:sugar transferase [Aquicoccus porphyridii]RAI54985.1 sugar transferase [Rhodobacteraceae bacterium AsT-22]